MNGASISTSDGYRVGSASLQLTGSTYQYQYVQIPSVFTGSRGLTLAFWFRSKGNPSCCVALFDLGNGAAADNIMMGIGNNGLVPFVFIGDNYNTPGWDSPVTTNVNDNQWRHVVWTLDPSGTWVVYINGVSVWTVTGQFYPRDVSRSSCYLGKGNWNGDSYFTGAIDEWRMYDYVFDASQVTALYCK